MKLEIKKWLKSSLISLIGSFAISIFLVGPVFADLYINILAVNGADAPQTKEINHALPKEVSKEDVIDADGLDLEYDVNEGYYYVAGNAKLEAKKTKTYKVRIRDVWKIDPNIIEDIKEEINLNLIRIKDTEFYDSGEIKKESLLQRLDFITKEQEKYADDIEKRIGRYRIYESELTKIRQNALSIKYWRTRPPTPEEADVFTFVIEQENPNKEEAATITPKHYLPKEVKPEHFVELQGFDVRYDALKGKTYLTKEEKLQASQKKRYDIGIIDIWFIKQYDLDDLVERTDKTLELLKNSEYMDSANYLAEGIYKNIIFLNDSQKVRRNINDHISAYRTNLKLYEDTVEDVEALEQLLVEIRKDLERSKVRNVLNKVSWLKSLTKIIETIFKKPSMNTAWKIIMGVVIFVGVYTFVHFVIWGKRSKNAIIKDEDDSETSANDTKDE
jgi:hypothetical protein